MRYCFSLSFLYHHITSCISLIVLVLHSSIFLQVKVWFQNRRTKYKRDRSRDHESADSKSESLATCNILRLLQNQVPRPTCTSYLPPYPYGFSGFSASWYYFTLKEKLLYIQIINMDVVNLNYLFHVDFFSHFDVMLWYLFLHTCMYIIIWFIVSSTKSE